MIPLPRPATEFGACLLCGGTDHVALFCTEASVVDQVDDLRHLHDGGPREAEL